MQGTLGPHPSILILLCVMTVMAQDQGSTLSYQGKPAPGGTRMNTNRPLADFQIVTMAVGGTNTEVLTDSLSLDAGDVLLGLYGVAAGTWTNASSRDLKENFKPIDRLDVLNRMATLPITRWNYKTEDDTDVHMGPMAEDFAKAFNLGTSDKAIATVDADGVALASIQALYEIIKEKDEGIRSLRAELASLDARLARLEALLGSGSGVVTGK
jgi:hypothetical protein